MEYSGFTRIASELDNLCRNLRSSFGVVYFFEVGLCAFACPLAGGSQEELDRHITLNMT